MPSATLTCGLITDWWYRSDADNQLRTAAYEVLNSFVTNSANDTLPIVASLSDVILQRLENTIPMQQQIVSVEDRITLEEMQTSLTSVLLVRLVALSDHDSICS
jgi:importin subunit beta-1